MLKKLGLLVAAVFATATLYATDIKWYESYDKAFAQAKATGKNVLALITAPSWCYWCQQFDKKVLSDASVQKIIDEGFVPLLILDTNADIGKVEISGFPTVRVYDKNASIVKDVYYLDPNTFKSAVDPYVKKDAVVINNNDENNQNSEIVWEAKTGLFQAGVVDWNNEIKRSKNISLEDAKKIAAKDPKITYFCFTSGPKLTINGKKTQSFAKGDAVFFSGDAVLSLTPGMGDTYVKIGGSDVADSETDDSGEELDGNSTQFREMLNVFQYAEADWNNEVRREKGLTLDQAKKIAGSDPKITYFSFVVGSRLVLPQGVFAKGDAVFFSGKPWYGSALNLGNSYEKVGNADSNKATKKFVYDNGYFQKLETGLWQGCDFSLCRNYKEVEQADAKWIMLQGYIAPLKKDGILSIPASGGQTYYWDDGKKAWVKWISLKASDAFGVVKFGAAPSKLSDSGPEIRQEKPRK